MEVAAVLSLEHHFQATVLVGGVIALTEGRP